MSFFSLTREEVDTLKSAHNSVDLAFFCLTVGVFFGLLAPLVLSAPKDAKLFGAFVAVCAVAFVASLYFGLRARSTYGRARQAVDRLLEERGHVTTVAAGVAGQQHGQG